MHRPRRADGLFATALLLVLALTACTAPAPRARHLVLITLDTTRADQMELYGGRARTPNLLRLADHGVVFTDATTVVPTTLASHTSMFTGLYPLRHGVPENGFQVPAANETLAEILSEQEFRTAGLVGSFALDRRFGIDQGFDHWDQDFDLLLHPARYDQNQRRAGAVVDAALAYLGAPIDPGDRHFLFVHLFDPHAPYDPPPPAGSPQAGSAPAVGLEPIRRAARAQQLASTGRHRNGLRVVSQGLGPELVGVRGEPSPSDRELAELYRGEIEYVDGELGRLFDGLRTAGLWDDAVVVVVADHGETFWEHGDFWNHGLALYQTTMHVPLVVRAPGIEAGVRGESVATVDLLPTVLELLGIDGGTIDGRSLVPVLHGGKLRRDAIFLNATQPSARRFVPASAAWHNEQKARAIRAGRYKLVVTPYLGTEELFDLETDPAEERNLLRLTEGAERRRAEDVRRRLRAHLDAWARSAHPFPSSLDETAQHDVRERLRALGYLR